MSQFFDRTYFGYRVIVRPDKDIFRKWLRIPIWNFQILPYLAGVDLLFSFKIIPSKLAMPCSQLKYDWSLFKKEDSEPCKSDSGYVDMSSNQPYKGKIDLGHFSYTNEYKLNIAITINRQVEQYTVVDFEMISRAQAQITFIWFVIGIIVGYFIGK